MAQLGIAKLDIIGGKDCEGVTKTPQHNEEFKLGDITVKGIHTPCHTQDSICFFMEDHGDKAIFTGDTLFNSGRPPFSLWCITWELHTLAMTDKLRMR